MKRKSRNLLMALFATLFGGAGWLLLPPRDSPFHGKPESIWIAQLSDGTWSMAQDQVEQWRAFGPDCVGVLIRALNNANRPVEMTYRKMHLRLRPWLPSIAMRLFPPPRIDSTRLTRECIADLLWRLGDNAKSAAPAMARALHDEDAAVRQHAIYFFTAGGTGSENALLNQMPEAEKRKLLPDFVRSMKEADSLNDGAAVALGYFPEQRNVVAPVLVNVLSKWGLREVPLEDWTHAIPELGALSSRVYVAARESLKRIAPDAQWAKTLLQQKVDAKAASIQGVNP